ncbi:MAG TPA: hypothetical protein VFT85_07695 [Acidimicrobiia bacterium]|nr:hypothetical protein [Acidimicrobiia bacterium]
MGIFTASLRAIGDVKSLPATVELDEGRLSIMAGTSEIGSWLLSDVNLEEIPTGYRLAAEGEQILIELKDLDGFANELAGQRKRRSPFGRRKADLPRRPEGTESVPFTRPSTTTDTDKRESGLTLPPLETTTTRSSGWTEKGLSLVDGTLAKANKKLGPYLPDWMFTRAMFAIAFGALVLMILLPGLVSTFLLIAGAVMVLFGAIVYSDTMLASRWLPGRTTAQHVLLFGVAILMMGVLLGVLAR